MDTPPHRPIDRHWRSTPILKPAIRFPMPKGRKVPKAAFEASRDLVVAIDHLGRNAPPECSAGEIAAAALLSRLVQGGVEARFTEARIDRIFAFLAASGHTRHPFYVSLTSSRARSFSEHLADAADRLLYARVHREMEKHGPIMDSLGRLSAALKKDEHGLLLSVVPALAPPGVVLSASPCLTKVYWRDSDAGGTTFEARFDRNLDGSTKVCCGRLIGDISPYEAGCGSAFFDFLASPLLRRRLADNCTESAISRCFAALNATAYLDVLLPIVSPHWEPVLDQTQQDPTPSRRPRIRL